MSDDIVQPMSVEVEEESASDALVPVDAVTAGSEPVPETANEAHHAEAAGKSRGITSRSHHPSPLAACSMYSLAVCAYPMANELSAIWRNSFSFSASARTADHSDSSMATPCCSHRWRSVNACPVWQRKRFGTAPCNSHRVP